MLVVALVTLVFFAWAHITASLEPPSVDSGTNFAVTVTMVLILFILFSFGSLQVSIDKKYLRLKFGFGLFWKNFLLNEIVSVKTVKNHWYYGWGIRLIPGGWLFNVSGFEAVELVMKNGKVYRIGTDEAEKLRQAVSQSI